MLQRWILVHSFIYYELNKNVVSDSVYDSNTKQLIKMQKEFPEIKTKYHYVFSDFISGTGFDLIKKLSPADYEMIERDSKIAVFASEKMQA